MTKKEEITQKWEQLELLDISTMRYIECNDGWLDLINRCLQELYDYREANHVTLKVTCIKEKFGGLRIHTSFHNDILWAIIQKYEEEASHTCEDCGIVADNVKVRNVIRSWIKCICDNCLTETKGKYQA